MEYTEGYLAFLDILGFSQYVNKEENGQATADLFDFVKKLCWFFNTSPELHIQISFFSDTIIMTTNELDHLILPINIAESYLKKSLGLLFRGGIVYGKYYHKDGVTFGPAVVAGYELEKKAIYSRILIDEKIDKLKDNISYFVDIDGCTCFNPFGMFFMEIVASAPEGMVYPDNIEKELIEKFSKSRDELLLQIKKHKGSKVVDKYLWRIRAYNNVCNFVANIPEGMVIYEDINYIMNQTLKELVLPLIISENDILNEKTDVEKTNDQL